MYNTFGACGVENQVLFHKNVEMIGVHGRALSMALRATACDKLPAKMSDKRLFEYEYTS